MEKRFVASIGDACPSSAVVTHHVCGIYEAVWLPCFYSLPSSSSHLTPQGEHGVWTGDAVGQKRQRTAALAGADSGADSAQTSWPDSWPHCLVAPNPPGATVHIIRSRLGRLVAVEQKSPPRQQRPTTITPSVPAFITPLALSPGNKATRNTCQPHGAICVRRDLTRMRATVYGFSPSQKLKPQP